MATAKTTTLTFRVEPALKEALRTVATREHRSIANMIEVLIRDYCGRVGVPIHVMPTPPLKDERKATPRKREKSNK